MFRRYAAAPCLHQFKDLWAHGVADVKKLINTHRLRPQDIQVQIAVANMAVPANLEARITLLNVAIDICEKSRHFADPHRQIVFIWGVGRQALGDAFTQLPQGCRLSLRLADNTID